MTKKSKLPICDLLRETASKIDGSIKAIAGGDRGQKVALRTHIKTYVDTVIRGLDENAIDCDPFGVINKNAIADQYARECVDAACKKANLKQRIETGVEVTTLDKLSIMDKIRSNKKVQMVKGKLSNGVKWSHNRVTGAFTLSAAWCRKQVVRVETKVMSCWKSFCEWFRRTFFVTKNQEIELAPA